MQKPNKFQALTQKTQIEGSPDGKERMDRQQAQINTQISVNQRQNPQQLNDKNDLNRSRRSSRSRVAEEDLPESYADLARRVYRMAEKEGWTQSKVMELLKNPAKLRKLEGFQKPLDPVIQRMIEDQEQRELKRQQLMDQQRKNEEESTMKSIMMAQSTSKEYFILLSAARQDYLMNSKKNTHFTKVVEQVPQSDFRPQTNAKSNKIIEKKNPKDEMGD